MAGAAAALTRRLYDEGRIHGVLSAGGSGNTAIATAAMQALPVGVPKLMVSTMAAGDTSDYVGGVDVMMMASVTDVAGINSISSRILANAAAAMAGMVLAPAPQLDGGRPLVAATMFGVTTPCVTRAREALEEQGLRGARVPRHGHGRKGHGGAGRGRPPERRARRDDDGAVRRPRRRRALRRPGPAGGRGAAPACRRSVSLGALDMVNFGARDTVPPKFEDRNLYVHNPSVTLMRTTPEEMRGAGAADRRASSPRPPVR